MLKVYTLEQSAEWDEIVTTFEKHDIYYLSGYVKAFKIHGDGEPLLFYYEGTDLRGINVVMKRDIANDKVFSNILEKNTYFDLSSPYGYCGWIFEGAGNLNDAFAEYEGWCYTNRIISEFVRFHPLINNQELLKPYYDVVALGNTITMDLNSPEIIWENIISKNRNMIRKAKKNGIRIYRGQYPEIYSVFREMYNGTMDRDQASDYYYFSPEFYDSILNDLNYNGQIFYAVYDKQVIAAAIILSCNGYMNYHLSGSLREFSNLAANNLLLYEVAVWGSLNGFNTFNLGGGVGSAEDGLFKFKKSFYKGEDLNRFHIGRKIFNEEVYDYLVDLRENNENSNFFPQYRA